MFDFTNANMETLAIPVGYLVLATILLWFVILSRGYWWLKTLTITGVLLFGLTLWYSVDSYLGWPSQEQVPQKFIVHWVIVNEPSKKTEDPGCIYVWVTKLKTKASIAEDESKSSYTNALSYQQKGKMQPRSFKLPYSDRMRAAASQAKRIIKSGGVVIGERSKEGGFGVPGKGGKGKGKAGKGAPGEGDGKGKGDSAFSFSRSDEIYFHELPPPKVPDKIYE